MRLLVTGLLATTVAAIGCGGSPSLEAGTYTGTVRCTGADRYSDGKTIDRFDSSPRVSVRLDQRGGLIAWTYLFLGRRDTVIPSRAVQPGHGFSYSAGAHIGRPGRTRVTVLDSRTANGEARLTASLDWASRSSGYVGAGTYTLRVVARGGGKVEYHAEKAVVKTPPRRPSRAAPVVRRTETCIGDLAR